MPGSTSPAVSCAGVPAVRQARKLNKNQGDFFRLCGLNRSGGHAIRLARPNSPLSRDDHMRQSLALGFAFALGLASTHGASAQIKLAVGGPMTGGSATFGAQLKNGVEQAIEDINGAGGILGQKIATPMAIGDDRADPKEGVSVANNFVGNGVKF